MLTLCLTVSPCSARTTIVIGTLSIGTDINERRYHDEDRAKSEDDSTRSTRARDEGDTQQILISPMFTIQSTGVRDELKLSYAPTAKNDLVTDESHIDHFLALQGKRLFTRDWSITLKETFVSADNLTRITSLAQQAAADTGSAASDELPRDQLTTDILHQRYYTNNAALRSDYTFARDSTVGVGYGLNILRNDTAAGSLSEFDRHELTTGVKWQASQAWKLDWDGWYVIGIFFPREETTTTTGTSVAATTEEDLREYRAKARLTYFSNGHTNFPLSYDFKNTDYQGERADSRVHEVLLGWERSWQNKLRLMAGAGPACVEVDDQDTSWDYAAYAGLEKKWPHAQLSCRLEKRFETDNFNGTDNYGLADIYLGRLQYTHHLTEALDGKFFLSLRDERRLDPQGQYSVVSEGTEDSGDAADTEYHKRRYQTGLGLSYRFWQRYAFSSDYSFARQEADLDNESYDEHLVQVRLSVEKELWRW